mmetsp:Transcript_3683/g.10592  ORF Transcript_3683/g.10592 Transcript_3683/m.10592 type:complete len:210 (-) Transcript_3683:553-1182(-)
MGSHGRRTGGVPPACRSIAIYSMPPRISTALIATSRTPTRPAATRPRTAPVRHRPTHPAPSPASSATVTATAPQLDFSRPTWSIAAESAAPPLLKTNKEPRLPFPRRTRWSRYVVVRTTSLGGPKDRWRPPKLMHGGSKNTLTVSPLEPSGSSLPRRPTAPLRMPSRANSTLFVTISGSSTDWKIPRVRKIARPMELWKRPPAGWPLDC